MSALSLSETIQEIRSLAAARPVLPRLSRSESQWREITGLYGSSDWSGASYERIVENAAHIRELYPDVYSHFFPAFLIAALLQGQTADRFTKEITELLRDCSNWRKFIYKQKDYDHWESFFPYHYPALFPLLPFMQMEEREMAKRFFQYLSVHSPFEDIQKEARDFLARSWAIFSDTAEPDDYLSFRKEACKLKPELMNAFMGMKYPGDDNLISCYYDEECVDLALMLRGISWDQIPIEIALSSYNEMTFLTHEAFHYYWPGFFIAGLAVENHKHHDIFYNLLDSLLITHEPGSDLYLWKLERLSHFKGKQYDVLSKLLTLYCRYLDEDCREEASAYWRIEEE